jgi:transketolase
LGVRDTFGESARDEEIDALLEKYGLTTKEMVHAVIECRSRGIR